MLTLWRRHNPARCDFKTRTEKKCQCPIWTSGTLPSGDRIYKTLKLRNWTLAEKLIDRWQLEGVQPKRASRIKIEHWKDSFIQDAKARNLASETVRKYKYVFGQLEDFATKRGDSHIDELNLETLTEFRASWKDGPQSAGRKLEILRTVLKFAVGRKWIEDNPAMELKTPRVKQAVTLPFSPAEVTAILAAAEGADKAFVLTMRHAGLRISDTVMLQVASLDGERLKLHQAKTGEPVSVLLPKFVADALRGVKRSTQTHFFWNGRSALMSATNVWRKRLGRVFKKAGVVNAHTHRMRDSFAVALLEAGVSIESVSMLLGHQNVRITQKSYSPWIKSRQDALDKEISRALQNNDNSVTASK